jgi:hypothetical protein
MVLLSVARDKFYFDVRFDDIPPDYILGGTCFVCCRKGPIDRVRAEKRHGATALLAKIDDRLRCIACGNRTANRFILYGRRVCEAPLPKGVAYGVPSSG